MVRTGYPENATVRFLYYEPLKEKFPSVIILHGYKVRKKRLEKQIGIKLAEMGVAGIVLTLPYYSSRKPKNVKSEENRERQNRYIGYMPWCYCCTSMHGSG